LIDLDAISKLPPIGLIPIHFDVPGHYLPLGTFIETAIETRAVIDTFNREVFDGKLEYQLLVLPPNEGSFLTNLGLVLLAGWTTVWTFTESDIGQAFIKGLTKHDPAHWAEAAGNYLREKVVEPQSVVTGGEADNVAQVTRRGNFETIIVVESTKSFLQTDSSDLRRVGITPQRFCDAYQARNRFYVACAANPEVRALGFDETDDFPIKRKDFVRLQVALAPSEDVPTCLPWEVEVTILTVTSPNWDKEDRQRQWKARDTKGRERYFRIDDEHFWSLARAQKLNPHITDTMRVQWAYLGNQRRNALVLRVLEYNDQILGEPLDDNALRAALGAYNQRRDDQEYLFGR
jgi:hypothetical protein